MTPTATRPPAAVLALTLAERARTLLSACDLLIWSRDGEPVTLPFVEEVGSPTLVLSRLMSNELLDVESGQLQTGPHPSLGTVRLTGRFWPLTDDASLAMLRTMRCQHAECGAACRDRLWHLVGLQVNQVELWLPEAQRLCVLDLETYQLARPNEILALGVKLAAHLNADHQGELRQVAAGLSRLLPDRVLSARIEWIDDAGFDLSVIDDTGGRQLQHAFPEPVRAVEDLSSAWHDTLARLVR